MRKWKLFAALAVVALAAFVLWPRTTRAMPANFDQIEKGIFRAEVQAILGPPGDYRTGPMGYPAGSPALKMQLKPNDKSVMVWDTDKGLGVVSLDSEGRVSESKFIPGMRFPNSPLENVGFQIFRLWKRLASDWAAIPAFRLSGTGLRKGCTSAEKLCSLMSSRSGSLCVWSLQSAFLWDLLG